MCSRCFLSDGVMKSLDGAGDPEGHFIVQWGFWQAERPAGWAFNSAAREAACTWALKHAENWCRFRVPWPVSEFGSGH